MNAEIIKQYGHTWKIFERIVKAFDRDAWLHTGRGTTTPARLAVHVLQGIKYYVGDSTITAFASGKPFDRSPETASQDELPSQDDVLMSIRDLRKCTDEWLAHMDYDAENTAFPWAGNTRLGVALFLLRHSVYHIGELSSLLNESRDGQSEDHWVNAL
jgi:hypothetical protein